jgi:hypothetical protein
MSAPFIITTPILEYLNKDAQQRNRSLNEDWIRVCVDPTGLHLLEQVLFHNDVEWRCRVLIKVRDRKEPVIGT